MPGRNSQRPKQPTPTKGQGYPTPTKSGVMPSGPGGMLIPTGQPHGDREVNEDLARQVGQGAGAAGGMGPGAQPMPMAAPPGDMFGPTAYPNEPITSGSPMGPGRSPNHIIPPDPDEALLALFQVYPHPDIAALIQYSANRKRQPGSQ